jgi:integrase
MDVTTIVTSMASLVRKPRSKFWFACFRDANGRQRRKSTRTSDRKKAIKIAEQYEQVGQRKMPARAVRETLAELYREIYNESVPTATIRTFVENWLKTKQPEISPATLAFYRKSTSKLLEFLGSAADLDLASVTRTTLVEFRNQVAQKASATTTNHDLRAIKALFREAKRDGYIAEDPSEFVDTVRKSFDDKRRPFTIAEIQRVLAVADSEWQSLVLFGLYTGQRLADIAALTWDNLDLNQNEIRLRSRKTAKRMMVPIAKPLRRHIDSLPAGDQPGTPIHPEAFAIISRHGRSANLSNHFADLLAQAGLRERAPHHWNKGKGRNSQRASNSLSFHSLRHTGVSLLKDAGIPEGVSMELVGHDSKSMSAHYTHVGAEALEKAVAALPEL